MVLTTTNLRLWDRRLLLQSDQVCRAEAIPRVQVAQVVFLIIQMIVHVPVSDTVSLAAATGWNWIVGVLDVGTRTARAVTVEASKNTNRGALDATVSLFDTRWSNISNGTTQILFLFTPNEGKKTRRYVLDNTKINTAITAMLRRKVRKTRRMAHIPFHCLGRHSLIISISPFLANFNVSRHG